MSFIKRFKNIRSNQKSGDIYYLYFTKHLSAIITTIISYTRVTPNMATGMMFVFGIIGAYQFSLGGIINYFFGGLMYVLLIIADTVDGELARFRGTSSLFGDYLDRLAHYVTNTSLYICIGLGLFLEFEQLWIFYVSVITMICYLFDDISRDLLVSCGLSKGNSRKGEKENLSITKGLKFGRIIYYTASNTAFFHLIIITSLLDYFNIFEINYKISHLYILYFFSVTILKTFYRLPLILSLKDK